MYYQGFQMGLGSLQAILRGLAGLYEDNLFLTDFYRFLDLPATSRRRRIQSRCRFRSGRRRVRGGALYLPRVRSGGGGGVDLTLAPGR